MKVKIETKEPSGRHGCVTVFSNKERVLLFVDYGEITLEPEAALLVAQAIQQGANSIIRENSDAAGD